MAGGFYAAGHNSILIDRFELRSNLVKNSLISHLYLKLPYTFALGGSYSLALSQMTLNREPADLDLVFSANLVACEHSKELYGDTKGSPAHLNSLVMIHTLGDVINALKSWSYSDEHKDVQIVGANCNNTRGDNTREGQWEIPILPLLKERIERQLNKAEEQKKRNFRFRHNINVKIKYNAEKSGLTTPLYETIHICIFLEPYTKDNYKYQIVTPVRVREEATKNFPITTWLVSNPAEAYLAKKEYLATKSYMPKDLEKHSDDMGLFRRDIAGSNVRVYADIIRSMYLWNVITTMINVERTTQFFNDEKFDATLRANAKSAYEYLAEHFDIAKHFNANFHVLLDNEFYLSNETGEECIRIKTRDGEGRTKSIYSFSITRFREAFKHLVTLLEYHQPSSAPYILEAINSTISSINLPLYIRAYNSPVNIIELAKDTSYWQYVMEVIHDAILFRISRIIFANNEGVALAGNTLLRTTINANLQSYIDKCSIHKYETTLVYLYGPKAVVVPPIVPAKMQSNISHSVVITPTP